MNNVKKAQTQLSSNNIDATIEGNRIYINVNDLILEISQEEIAFQAEQYDNTEQD